MKKLFTIALVALLTTTGLTSCGTYHSASTATSLGQLSGNPFMQSVANTVIKDMGNMLLKQGIGNVASKLNLGTSLNSILSTAQAVSGFKNMLTGNYNIPATKVESGFGNFSNLGSVVNFVAQNASGIKF